MTEPKFLEIDGAYGEGGGAILRLSAGFSVLYNRPIKIKNIRANRPKPGLRLQHLLGLKTLSELTNSTLSKCEIGTTKLTFVPKKDIKNTFHVAITTAASVGLLLQPIQIACLGFARPEKIEIILDGGGTFGKWAPSLNYLREVTYQIFERSGLRIEIELVKEGFYPKGGAYTKCTLFPPQNKLKPLDLTELGSLKLIQGEIIITNQLKSQKRNIGDRIRNTINNKLKNELNIKTDIEIIYTQSISPGVGLSLWALSDIGAIISTGTILGERKTSSEELGNIAAKELIKYIKNDIPVDNYLSDQLIPLMAYIKAPSRIKVLGITSHTRTNLDLIKLFTNREHKIIKEKNGSIIEFL